MSAQDNRNGGGTGDVGTIPQYLGPYEAWNFGAGQPYALPMMRRYKKYISALAEIGLLGSSNQAIRALEQNSWVPTLWGDPKGLTFIPFVVGNPSDRAPTPNELQEILQAGFGQAIQDLPGADASLTSSEHTQSVQIWFDRIKDSRFRVAFPITDAAMHTDVRPQPSVPLWHPDDGLRARLGQDKEITVIAIIDDGLPFAHRNFRDKTGSRSRVEFCWLQSASFDRNQTSVLFGREYSREQIECLIGQYGDDEDALYRAAGATQDTEGLGSLIDRHATHGAHVMDLATGYAPERGRQAPDAKFGEERPREEIRIIAVQLPNTISWDTSGFGKDMYMLSAFHYIFHRADIIARGYKIKNLRLVINFSYGFTGGRHDGETELEAAIDELVCKRRTRKAQNDDDPLGPSPTALVLPAGNTFLDRLHGLISEDDFVNESAAFHWRVQPNDRTSSYLELWFSQGFNPQGYRIELWDPRGRLQSSFNIDINQGTRTSPGDPNKLDAILNDTHQQVGQISVDLHRSNGAPFTQGSTGRYRVLIVLAPTDPEDPKLPRADAGKWTVVIQRGVEALADTPIHCWIQRSADPEQLRSGSRQSYFEDYAYEHTASTPQGDISEVDHKTFVQRFGTLNGLATGRTTLVVGGYRLGAGLGSSIACARPARYSAAGVLPDHGAAENTDAPPCPVGPRAAAAWPDKQVNASSMSDRSRALPGTIAAGVRSGSLSLVQGTSAAAPFVARKLAEIFTIADAAEIAKWQDSNYLTLISNDLAKATERAAGAPDPDCVQPSDDTTEARLGKVRVPPHWQPGVEPR